MFSCPLCEKEFKYQALLNSHLVVHTKEKPHKCSNCSAAFGLLSRLKQHNKTVHERVKKIPKNNTQCPMCAYTCRGKANLEVHLRKHSAERPFSCNVQGCDHKAKYETNLKRHIRTVHSDERPYECPEAGCSHRAKSKKNLTQHLKVHSSEKPFACQVQGCHHSCKSKSSLKVHTFLVHTDEKPFKCSTCDYRTNHKTSLKLHQDSHGNIKSFECRHPNCSYASYHKQRVDRHFDGKHRNKNIRCTQPGCNLRYASTTLLNIHLKTHELPILKCPSDSCKFSTRYKKSLLTHVFRFHKDVQSASVVGPRNFNLQIPETAGAVKSLHCSVPNCGYQTEFQHRYDHHRLTHNREEKKEHVCIFCFARFTQIHILNIHIRRHLEEKPYSCSHCKYTAVTSSKLREHAGSVHHIYAVPDFNENDRGKCRTCNAFCSSRSELVLHSMTHLRPAVVIERLRVNVL